MNLTITIDKLADSVALATQSDRADALNFIRQTFALAAEILLEEESVEIPRLGTFMAVEGTLRFRPDPELAESINAPFAAFSAVELPDDYRDEDDVETTAAEHETVEGIAPAATEVPVETAESTSEVPVGATIEGEDDAIPSVEPAAGRP
ncbi:MAG: hypothetical protein K2M97_00820, partial [Muribaculaceae bacterium]|nr:hypothetical protein [Muribaculaceae bacterium]